MGALEGAPELADQEGKLTEHAHPLVRRIERDFEIIEAYGDDDVAQFFTTWASYGRSWRALCLQEEVSEAMSYVAPEAVRARWCHMSLLRAGHRGEDSSFESDPDAPRYRCGLLSGKGEMCEREFRSRRACALHQRYGGGGMGEHGMVRPLYTVVLTNMCPWCRSTFASRVSASHHCVRSYRSGLGTMDRGAFAWTRVESADTECPFCEFGHSVFAVLQAHIFEHHFPHPFPTIRVFRDAAGHAPPGGEGEGGGLLVGIADWWARVRRRRE